MAFTLYVRKSILIWMGGFFSTNFSIYNLHTLDGLVSFFGRPNYYGLLRRRISHLWRRHWMWIITISTIISARMIIKKRESFLFQGRSVYFSSVRLSLHLCNFLKFYEKSSFCMLKKRLSHYYSIYGDKQQSL